MVVHDGNPFIGLAGGILTAVLSVGAGGLALRNFTKDLPTAARVGIFGAVGLGILGLLIFLTSPISFMFPNGAVAIWGVFAIIGLIRCRKDLQFSLPVSPIQWTLLLFIVVLLLLRLPAALSPSDASDWDSISHQMAMSKIWLKHGRVDYIPYMHQSNIPATINMVYCWGLEWAGQFGAKSIAFFFTIFALFSLGGLTGFRYGKNAGYWAALAFVATPVVLWETGSAYVDVAHGLYSGLAFVFAAMWLFPADTPRGSANWLVLAGTCLGFSSGTKYTGLQFGLAIAVVFLGAGVFSRQFGYYAKGFALVAIIAALVSCPWYLRNIANTGNPVYPFFYSVFDGKNWSAENAAAYTEEQKSFGVGHEISALPGSATALALQPDKQINEGTPWGAIGPLFLLGLLWWPLSGRARKLEGALIMMVCISLLSWFALTQQSRYIIALAFPSAMLFGGAVVTLRLGWLCALAVTGQAIWSLSLFLPSQDQVRFVAAGLSQDDYLGERFRFWVVANYLNEFGKYETVRVALFDEPRGYYLDVDYWWANPGHSRLIHYENLRTGEDLVRELKRLGTTHVYLNLAFSNRKEVEDSLLAFRDAGQGKPPRRNILAYRWLIADAYYKRLLVEPTNEVEMRAARVVNPHTSEPQWTYILLFRVAGT